MSSLIADIAQAIPGFNGWQPSEVSETAVLIPTEHATYRIVEIAPRIIRFYAHSPLEVDDVGAHAVMVGYLNDTAPLLMAGRLTRLTLTTYEDHTLLTSQATIPLPQGLSADQLSRILSRLIVESEIMLTYTSARFEHLPRYSMPYATSNMRTFLPAEILEPLKTATAPYDTLSQFLSLHVANAPATGDLITRIISLLEESEFTPAEPREVDDAWGVGATLNSDDAVFQFVANPGLVSVVMIRTLPQALDQQDALRLVDAGNAFADVFTMVNTDSGGLRSDTTEEKAEPVTQRILQSSFDTSFELTDEQLYESLSNTITVVMNADRRLTEYQEFLEGESPE
ncbi:MAG: hypothetical protein GX483_01025 [Actinomycetaceae bacterium]|nr:hypothetical protein [Actinomycetaceae bacterium]